MGFETTDAILGTSAFSCSPGRHFGCVAKSAPAVFRLCQFPSAGVTRTGPLPFLQLDAGVIEEHRTRPRAALLLLPSCRVVFPSWVQKGDKKPEDSK